MSRIFSSSTMRDWRCERPATSSCARARISGSPPLGQLLGLGELGGHRLVLAVLLHQRLEVAQHLGLLAILRGIVLDGRGSERGGQLLVARFHRRKLVEHRVRDQESGIGI